MVFKDGDFLEIEYSAWRALDSKLLYTTVKEKAQEAGIYDEHESYGSALVILGQNAVVKGLERELKNMSVGESKKFELKPEEAFGNRDENLVRVMPLAEFKEQNINPVAGMTINIDGVPSTVKSVNSGRVVVDQNHPEAGMSIIYEVKVLKLLENDKEKIDMLGKTYGARPSKVDIKEGEVELYYDDKVKKNADYFVGRANLVASIFNYISSAGKVYIREEYVKPKAAEIEHDEEK
ncbi:MAG: FKBP-type peptidyl-prolyl cis-trans isomerase [Candidatus Micrarchaeia archaeon]